MGVIMIDQFRIGNYRIAWEWIAAIAKNLRARFFTEYVFYDMKTKGLAQTAYDSHGATVHFSTSVSLLMLGHTFFIFFISRAYCGAHTP